MVKRARGLETKSPSIFLQRAPARAALHAAVVALDADMKRRVGVSNVCRRPMTIAGAAQLTALAFAAAIYDPERVRRSRDLVAYLGLMPRRYWTRAERRRWVTELDAPDANASDAARQAGRRGWA